jgi:O-methyltransferase involved in polyketide biosynthesis
MNTNDVGTKTDNATTSKNIIISGQIAAYCNTFTDTKFANEVYYSLKNSNDLQNPKDRISPATAKKIAPHIEVRRKLADRLIKKTGIKQILAIGTGLSSRGLEMTSDKDVVYVEFGMSDVMDQKRKIIKSISEEEAVQPKKNLHLEEGSPLSLTDLIRATRYFDETKPVLVINELLMQFLDWGEKEQYAINIATLLKNFRGIWITPVAPFRSPNEANAVKNPWVLKMLDAAGTKDPDKLFKDKADARRFFDELGFSTNSYTMFLGNDCKVTTNELSRTSKPKKAIFGSIVYFVATPQKKGQLGLPL